MHSRKGKEEPIKQEESKDWKGKNTGENDCKLSRFDLSSEEEDYFQNFQIR